MDIDLGAAFGAEEASSTQRLVLYIPNKDKSGNELKDHERWVREAREFLSHIGGGSTTFPPADGTWIDEKGEILWEQTRMVFCFIFPDQFRARLGSLREFLHRFGRETNQGEVVVELEGEFFRIRSFDPPGGN
jgi:hypothetical protein